MLVNPVLECVRWLCGHDIFRKTVPLWYHSLTEEFSDVQSGSFNRNLHTMSCEIMCIILSDSSKKLLLSMFSFPIIILYYIICYVIIFFERIRCVFRFYHQSFISFLSSQHCVVMCNCFIVLSLFCVHCVCRWLLKFILSYLIICPNEVSSFPPSFQRDKSKTLQSVTIFI